MKHSVCEADVTLFPPPDLLIKRGVYDNATGMQGSGLVMLMGFWREAGIGSKREEQPSGLQTQINNIPKAERRRA